MDVVKESFEKKSLCGSHTLASVPATISLRDETRFT